MPCIQVFLSEVTNATEKWHEPLSAAIAITGKECITE